MEQEIINALNALAAGVPDYYEALVSDYIARYSLMAIGQMLIAAVLAYLAWRLGKMSLKFAKTKEKDQWSDANRASAALAGMGAASSLIATLVFGNSALTFLGYAVSPDYGMLRVLTG